MTSSFPSDSGRLAGQFTAAVTLLFTGFLLLAAGLPSTAAAASAKRVDLGANNLETLTPNCGRNFSRDCVAEGKTTIFQSKSRGIDGRTFEVPWAGKLITWSISLAAVTNKELTVGEGTDAVKHGAQLPFFNNVFGSPASARIAVLKRVNKKAKGAPQYRLARQSPVEILNPYFGTKVTFVLDKPLNVIKGQMIGLTVPTWAPALWKPRVCNSFGDSMLDPGRCNALLKSWSSRTSRTPQGEAGCTLGYDSTTSEPNEALAKSRPQTKVDSERRYGCYNGPQAMLYSATIVAPK